MTPPPSSVKIRFMNIVGSMDRPGCIIWPRSRTKSGYGKIGWKQYNFITFMDTHRLAWIIYKGPIPNGLHVCHRCNFKACVNIKHLYLGTRFDNMQDASRDGLLKKKRKNISLEVCHD